MIDGKRVLYASGLPGHSAEPGVLSIIVIRQIESLGRRAGVLALSKFLRRFSPQQKERPGRGGLNSGFAIG